MHLLLHYTFSFILIVSLIDAVELAKHRRKSALHHGDDNKKLQTIIELLQKLLMQKNSRKDNRTIHHHRKSVLNSDRSHTKSLTPRFVKHLSTTTIPIATAPQYQYSHYSIPLAPPLPPQPMGHQLIGTQPIPPQPIGHQLIGPQPMPPQPIGHQLIGHQHMGLPLSMYYAHRAQTHAHEHVHQSDGQFPFYEALMVPIHVKPELVDDIDHVLHEVNNPTETHEQQDDDSQGNISSETQVGGYDKDDMKYAMQQILDILNQLQDNSSAHTSVE